MITRTQTNGGTSILCASFFIFYRLLSQTVFYENILNKWSKINPFFLHASFFCFSCFYKNIVIFLLILKVWYIDIYSDRYLVTIKETFDQSSSIKQIVLDRPIRQTLSTIYIYIYIYTYISTQSGIINAISSADKRSSQSYCRLFYRYLI